MEERIKLCNNICQEIRQKRGEGVLQWALRHWYSVLLQSSSDYFQQAHWDGQGRSWRSSASFWEHWGERNRKKAVLQLREWYYRSLDWCYA